LLHTLITALDISLTFKVLTSDSKSSIMYKQIGHRPTITEASMHIGSYVQKKGSKSSLGVITNRPPISGCWRVMWIKGNNRGSTLISQEAELVKADTKA
jgi:hypothetical protein